jgi:hypothetical protein
VYVSASPFLLLPLTELTPSPLKTYCWIDRKKSIEGVFLCDVCGFDLADMEDADGVKREEDKMASSLYVYPVPLCAFVPLPPLCAKSMRSFRGVHSGGR